MPRIRRTAVLALLVALAGCSAPPTRRSEMPIVVSSPPAHVGFGGPATEDVDEALFRTPSENIFCSLTHESARCDIVRKNWKAPPKPAGCEGDYGNGLYVEAAGSGLTCAGDTLIGSTTRTLEYGSGLRSGPLLCTSENTGMTCENETTGHGFELATADYALF